jgi:hypothetical protein
MASLPPWPLVDDLLRTLVLPAGGTAAAVLAIVCLLTKSRAARLAGGALAVAAGLAAGNHLRGILDWWPAEVRPSWSGGSGWTLLLPFTVAALAAGVLAAAASCRSHGVGLVVRLIAAAGGAWWLAEALPPRSFHQTTVIMFAGIVLNGEALLLAGRRSLPAPALPALVIPWGAAAAAVLIFAHSARFFDLAVLMTAIFAGVCLVAAIGKLDLTALIVAPAMFFPALMLAGAANTYSEVPVTSFAVIAFAPCALWLLQLPPFRRWPAPAVAIAAVVAALIPCIAGVALAARVETIEFSDYE